MVHRWSTDNSLPIYSSSRYGSKSFWYLICNLLEFQYSIPWYSNRCKCRICSRAGRSPRVYPLITFSSDSTTLLPHSSQDANHRRCSLFHCKANGSFTLRRMTEPSVIAMKPCSSDIPRLSAFDVALDLFVLVNICSPVHLSVFKQFIQFTRLSGIVEYTSIRYIKPIRARLEFIVRFLAFSPCTEEISHRKSDTCIFAFLKKFPVT
jgi:hypothetical protein